MAAPYANRPSGIDTPFSDRDQVLMIVGSERSGSTILGSLLGEVDRYVHVGELNCIWSRGLVENRLCGCGVQVRKCSFWQNVFDDAYGGIENIDLADILKTKSLIERTRKLPRLLSQVHNREISDGFVRYKQTLTELYKSILNVSGANVVVDSSKAPSYAYIIESIPTVDLRTIHLIRDSRAVSYSKRRKRLDPSIINEVTYLGQEPLAQSSLIWNVLNSLLFARPPGNGSMLLRYEDFVDDPGKALDSISQLMSSSENQLRLIGNQYEITRRSHTVFGNPVRFQSHVKISPDMEWKEKMPISSRALVTALTLPVLLRAGYPLVPKKPEPILRFQPAPEHTHSHPQTQHSPDNMAI